MAFDTITETPDAEMQKKKYNEASGMVKRKTYSPAAGTNWAIVGLVLADAFDKDTDGDTLISAIEALAGVTSVAGDQVYGQIPSSILAADHECKVHVTSNMSCQIGYGADLRGMNEKQYEPIKPPLNKKWAVIVLVVPSALDATGISDLEAALEGITGITTAEHLIDGTVPSNASSIQITAEVRMRIDPVPVPVE